MTNYMVEPKSRKELRNLARAFRRKLQLDNCIYFPVVPALDVLTEIFPDFNYEIVEDNELPENEHADTNIKTGLIRIKQSVYDGACNGEGRDRMTIAHEIGHYLMLYFVGFKLERSYGEKKIEPFRDPEWQAKCFAGELMVAAHLVGGMSAEEIAENCGVSYDAAKFQYRKIKEVMLIESSETKRKAL